MDAPAMEKETATNIYGKSMKSFPHKHFSHSPEWDESAFLDALQKDAVTSVRINPRKNIGQDLADKKKIPWSDNGFYLEERPVFTLDPLYHAGAYYVQEASSMFVEYAFKNAIKRTQNPLKILDLCAAPGGKSTLLASLIRDDDLLIANEVIQSRAAILSENITRWGHMNTWVTNNDPKDFSGIKNYFDLMLIDAPCTGSGLWRKDEKAIGEWSEAHIKLCADRQKRIIADTIPSLKNNGILFYATCSYSVEENEEILDWICENYSVESMPFSTIENWGIVVSQSAKHKAYGYRFYPWRLQGEGFFMAAFIVKNQTSDNVIKKATTPSRQMLQAALRWKEYLHTEFHILEKNENHIAIHPQHWNDYHFLHQFLKIRKTGTLLGKILPKEIIPEHELALSIHLHKDVDKIEVSKEDALHFLKKESILNDKGLKGWRAVSYKGLPLGWGKWLGNRMNNYLPKNLRIRMDIET